MITRSCTVCGQPAVRIEIGHIPHVVYIRLGRRFDQTEEVPIYLCASCTNPDGGGI